MTNLVSPGIEIAEFDVSTTIRSVSDSPGGFSGVFQWGPVGIPMLVDAETVLADTFWKPSNFNPETWFSCASFLGYTDTLYVVRAADVTGNTQTVTFSGNSTNFSANGGNNIMAFGNTTGLAAGQVLFYSNDANVPVGAIINSVNSTAVVLSAPVAANVQSVSVMFRDNVSYTAAALESDLSYTPLDVQDWDSLVVTDENAYTDLDGSFDAAALYVARWPGEPGNSLRVAVCDTPAQFSSNTVLAPNAQINSVASVVQANVGSNVITVTVSPTSTANTTQVSTANTYANSLKASIAVGDLVEIGNTTIGFQFLKVLSVSNVAVAANVASFTLTCDDECKLSSNVSVNYLSRFWEFYNRFDAAPSQSDYVLAHGNTAANDELHMVVVDELGKFTGSPGTILETYSNMSRAIDAKAADNLSIYYKNVINTRSKYVWWANDRTTAVSNTAQFVQSSSGTMPLDMQMVGGSSGLDEANVPLGTLALGWDKFASSEDIDVSLLFQGKARGEAVTNKTQLANYIIDNVVLHRSPARDCILFASPDIDDVVNNKGFEVIDVLAFEDNLRDTSYAVCDSGYKYMYDKYNDVNRWIPLNADIAGLCARTDKTNDAWWSPGGLTRGQILNVTRLAWNPRQAQRDALYKKSVNPVISTPGLGTYLYGDKTLLKQNSAFSRINVRRLFIVLEKAISLASRYQLFEFNDDFTRAQFRNMVNPYLRDIKGKRGIYDFKVICDATNNTPNVIDNNEFVGTIMIKPARSINYIRLNFVAVATGVSFETVVGFGG